MVMAVPIVSWAVAALLGSYALAHTASNALFGALPMTRGEAAIQLSFVVYGRALSFRGSQRINGMDWPFSADWVYRFNRGISGVRYDFIPQVLRLD